KRSHSLGFESRTNKNFRIKKEYDFDRNSGINTLEISVSNLTSQNQMFDKWQLKMGPGLGTVENEKKENTKLWEAKYAVLEKDRKHPTVYEIDENTSIDNWSWVGIDNRYFLAAIIGNDDLADNKSILFDEPEIDDKEAPFISMPFASTMLRPNETKTWRIDFYIGPKDYEKLEDLGHGLDRSVDFGFFSPLAKLANSLLLYFFNLTGNYGFAIIILSIILQILMFPLSWKSYKAMNMMKKLQPELQSLQKRYKDDPKRLNTEVMAMYKKHGTNPLGGCLPMLLQIPIFFALFTALRNSWALHGADFIFWITDLSSKDPFYVLPITMGAIMLLQQHVTPQTAGGDKGQMAVMKWMPVIFTFMFLTFPAGLVLYWLINSVSSFAQQLYLQKQSK
ncbi:MAG: membrane protein insertase YidC, partial [Elusimicrobiota bacterium]|nr:membrane protein insertase YidC [Elusimicrobiota bacterium]